MEGINGIQSILEFKSNLQNAQDYIKDTYNINSRYNEEENVLYLDAENINEALDVVSAKDYLEETFDSLVDIQYEN